MERVVGTTRLVLTQGDLTTQEVDAIVNAANSSLLGGGGVDGAIHRAGGPAILEECKRVIARIGRLDTGKAVMTTGGNLAARHVIHTVGPVWYGGASREPELLGDAYRNCLLVAEREGLRSVAFPAISVGAFQYPLKDAARVALQTIAGHLRNGSTLEEVRLVIFGPSAIAVWEQVFAEVVG
jgi:O-acetyl-ADP-ribose deacetylase (regulator of RNase III)